MAVSVEQFGKALVASGLLSAAHVKDVWAGVPADARPADGAGLARLLVERGDLTSFQAQEILAGRGARLVMGEYAILKEIGAGGMGKVYQAKHVRMDRIVALKVMSAAAMKDADSVKRFRREVQAAARLEHPKIVTAYASGEATGGGQYLVMQFVDGGDLASLVKQNGPLEVERAVDYAMQAAEGLAYAHGEGVIHRDIKPANLLVDKKGTVKILDMGLARIEDDGGDGLTATEQVMGTVDYMSPEQASSTKNADARSDVYSLGCTLWFMLTGKKLYEAESMIGRLMAHRDAPLPSLVKARDDASWPLEQVLHRMIAKRPDDRFQTMDEVAAALAPLGTGGSSSGMGSSLGLAPGPVDAQLASFLQGGGGRAVPPPTIETRPADELTGAVTEQLSTPEVGTDAPRPSKFRPAVAPAHDADSRAQVPQRNVNRRSPAVLAGGAGVAALAVGIGMWMMFGGDSSVKTVPEPTPTVVARPAALPPSPAPVAPSPPPNVVASKPQFPLPGSSPVMQRLESTKFVWTAPRNAGPKINDASGNSSPTLTADQLAIVATAESSAGSDLREFRRPSVDAPWGEPIYAVGTDYERDPFLSADGLTLLFASNGWKGPGYVGGWDIWMRRRPNRDAPWGTAENLGPNINTAYDEGGPALSGDGLMLAFHAIRPDGFGERDLYYSTRPSLDAPFGPPQNLGRNINSVGNDMNPRFVPGDRNLLFERGGTLYVTFRNSSGAVGAISLPEQPDRYYAPWLSPDGETLYFHRGDLPGGRGANDVWFVRRVPRDSPEAKAPPPPIEEAFPIPAVNAVAFAGHSYQWVPGAMTWFDAQQTAAAMGGHLVTVTSQAEHDWLRGTLVADLPPEHMIWIGLLKEHDNKWRWCTGEPVEFDGWRPGESLDGPYAGAAYAHNSDKGLAWADWPALSQAIALGGDIKGQSRCKGCIVEWDAPTPGPLAPPAPIQHRGHRYLLVVDKPLNWFDAKAAAEAQGGHLLTIEDRAERDWFAETLWPRVPMLEGHRRIWLGGSQEALNAPWQWVTGAALDPSLWGGSGPNDTNDALHVASWLYVNAWDDTAPTWRPLPYVVEWDDAAKSP